MASTDPILNLIKDPPETFLALPEEEQAWRGRLWLVLFATGFATDMAWWMALRDPAEEDMIAVRKTMERVTDEQIPDMVAGRIYFDIELARQAAVGGQ